MCVCFTVIKRKCQEAAFTFSGFGTSSCHYCHILSIGTCIAHWSGVGFLPIGQDSLFAAPAEDQLAKPRDQEHHGDGSEVTAIDEELQEERVGETVSNILMGVTWGRCVYMTSPG